MPGRDFFARMAPEFAHHAGSARDNADRQASVQRLIAKAEYEFSQVRRELVGLIDMPPQPIEASLGSEPPGATLSGPMQFAGEAPAAAKAA